LSAISTRASPCPPVFRKLFPRRPGSCRQAAVLAESIECSTLLNPAPSECAVCLMQGLFAHIQLGSLSTLFRLYLLLCYKFPPRRGNHDLYLPIGLPFFLWKLIGPLLDSFTVVSGVLPLYCRLGFPFGSTDHKAAYSSQFYHAHFY